MAEKPSKEGRMAELLIFYGILSVPVVLGVAYCLHLYHKHEQKQGKRHGHNVQA